MTAFDGIYEGPGRVADGATCAGAPSSWTATLTVSNGQFRLVSPMGSFGGPTISGRITADGSLRNQFGSLGKIENGHLAGRASWPSGCRHVYDLRRT